MYPPLKWVLRVGLSLIKIGFLVVRTLIIKEYRRKLIIILVVYELYGYS